MDFKISKPTLLDIPKMRNLIMPEVQKGIILDRSEDEMAGAIRSYSVIRVVDSANFCHSERSEESKKNNRDYSFRTSCFTQNDNVGVDSSLRECSAQNDKNSVRVAESSADSAFFSSDSAIPKQMANSSIFDEKSGLCSHEQGNRTDEFIDEASGKLPDLSQKDAEFAGEIVAFASLQILSLTLAEVRSLIVAPDFRRKGLATLLINHLLNEARELNIKEVLSLTYQREVFEKLGFKEIAKESLPNQKIWADCIKCTKFPVCDEIALLKTL